MTVYFSDGTGVGAQKRNVALGFVLEYWYSKMCDRANMSHGVLLEFSSRIETPNTKNSKETNP